MTLNQVLDRLRALCLAHKQIRGFHRGVLGDCLNDRTSKYAAVVVQDNGGSFDISGKTQTLSYRIFFLDLVNVSFRTKENEQEVQSDMLSIAGDIVAEVGSQKWNDWKISRGIPISVLYEQEGDMLAGVAIDISIITFFENGACEAPTSEFDFGGSGEDKNVYDFKYVATGDEGSILTTEGENAHIPIINGKKILLITREFGPLYKVSNLPESSEFIWDGQVIELGAPTNKDERFLILYRAY